jgi:altronate hydrolase
MCEKGAQDLKGAAVIVRPATDNVAVAKRELSGGARYVSSGAYLVVREEVKTGERIALRDIGPGAPVVQFGYPFGISRGILAGERITSDNTSNQLPPDIPRQTPPLKPAPHFPGYAHLTFPGYRRSDGRCGTRNYYLIVPTSMCASATASLIARQFERDYKGIDGVISLPNTEGCGCAGGLQVERFLRVLREFVCHPNVGGALMVDLGCEQTNAETVRTFLARDAARPESDLPVDWVTIQQEGGSEAAVRAGARLVSERIARLASTSRSPCPLSSIVVGGECGASDAFSGISANQVIGRAVDKVIYGEGAAIISEIPEMRGAESFLLPRMRNRKVAQKFRRIMRWYSRLAGRLGYTMDDNLVPENKAGGLINPFIKSLGAVMKGGTTSIEGVLEYGERIGSPGLHIMQGPGNDLESVTGLAASGATIICFSTGRGTVTGSAVVPVIKISSTTTLYDRLPQDIDFDAGPVLDADDPEATVEELGGALLERIISTASGERTWAERNQQRQFQVWTAGKLSL